MIRAITRAAFSAWRTICSEWARLDEAQREAAVREIGSEEMEILAVQAALEERGANGHSRKAAEAAVKARRSAVDEPKVFPPSGERLWRDPNGVSGSTEAPRRKSFSIYKWRFRKEKEEEKNG